MFERYTEEARRVIFFARFEASNLHNPEIDDVHLTLGILRAASYLIRRIVPTISMEDLRQQLSEAIFNPQGENIPTSVDLPLSNRSKQILFSAAEEAEISPGRKINVAHLLLALTLHPNSPSVDILSRNGVTAAKVREQLPRFQEEGETSATRQNSAESRARVGQALGCMEIVWGSQRVGIAALAATTHIPRQGEEIVINDIDTGLRSFRVVDVTYYYENDPPSIGSPHRLAKVVVRVDSPASRVGGAFHDAT